jgi:hypothetical protein
MADEMYPPKEFVNPFDPDAKNKTDANIEKDASYRDKLRLIILDGKDKEITSYSLDRPSEEAIYRFRHYFASPGNYTIHTEFFPLGERSVIKFPVSIETPGGVPWIIISGIVAIVVFSLILLLKKRKFRTSRTRAN